MGGSAPIGLAKEAAEWHEVSEVAPLAREAVSTPLALDAVSAPLAREAVSTRPAAAAS